MFVFLSVSPPRLSIGTGRRCREGHWSNIQLTRVELSTPDAAIEIASEKVTASTLPQTGFRASGVWKRRDKENSGKRRAEEDIWWTLRQRSTIEDNQWTDKGRASSKQTQPEHQTDEDRAN